MTNHEKRANMFGDTQLAEWRKLFRPVVSGYHIDQSSTHFRPSLLLPHSPEHEFYVTYMAAGIGPIVPR